MPEFTDEQIERGIHHALMGQDIEVIPGLIALLALQNPKRADEIRTTILLGLAIASRTNEGGEGDPMVQG